MSMNQDLKIEETFKKNDLDSLDIFTLLSSFEDFYKIKLKDNDFKLIKNFKELKKKIK